MNPFKAEISVNTGGTPMPPLAFVSHTLFLHIGISEFFLAWSADYAACKLRLAAHEATWIS